MRILFVLPYGPTLVRVRARRLLAELASRNEVTLVALAWNELDRAAMLAWEDRCTTVHVVDHALRPAAVASKRMLREPLQYAVARSADCARLVRQLIHDANTFGRPFDVVHVEHMRGAAAVDLFDRLPVRTVFDSVDCLSELAGLTREYGPNLLVRRLAAFEQPRTRHIEAGLLQRSDVVTVVADRDRQALLQINPEARVVVIPNGVAVDGARRPLPAEPRVVFSGKLSYHANSAAARVLVNHIWPLVRSTVPDAELTIAGADPPRWLRRHDGVAGIRIVANPPDMAPVIRAARVSVAPIVYSVGIQNKVLEAMAHGLPVVATRSAMAGLLPGNDGVLAQADNPGTFAAAISRLLESDEAAQRQGDAGYEYVMRHHSWTAIAQQLEELYMPLSIQQRAA